MKLNHLVVCAAGWGLLACGPSIQQAKPRPNSAAVIVLDEATLAHLPGQTVLDAITLRLPQVRTFAATGGCPGVLLRGTDRLAGVSNPDVYVDHAHALDTCPLSTLWATDVRRVAIYPLGVTSRAGYMTAPHGLILVFTRGSRAQ